jgi:hypothetical protein
MQRLTVCLLIGGIVALAAPQAAPAATTRLCGSISNPYPDTRYEGVPLSRITATGVTCATARRVARGAHRKALGRPANEDGVRVLSWDGWRVVGDLAGNNDRYTATKRGNTVRWRF